jgi:hypothetical protein
MQDVNLKNETNKIYVSRRINGVFIDYNAYENKKNNWADHGFAHHGRGKI